jgi:hemerythrin
MKVIEWKDEYSVGNFLMDIHHQLFLKIVEELNEVITSGKRDVDRKEVLNFLIEYLDMHLRSEEGLMKSGGYPDIEAHEAKHHEFEKKIYEIERSFNEDNDSLNLEDLLELLQTWLVSHILKEDKQYMPYIE